MTVPILDSANNGAAGSVSPITWLHTCSGVNRYLTVMIAFRIAIPTGLAVTYNGVTMTLIGSIDDGTRGLYVFGLINPATGSNTVSASWTSGNANMVGTSVSYTNVSLNNPVGTAVTRIDASSPTSINIVLGDSDIGIDAISAIRNTTPAPTITETGTNQTARTLQTFTSTVSLRGRQSDITGTGTVASSWTVANFTGNILQLGMALHGYTPKRRTMLNII